MRDRRDSPRRPRYTSRRCATRGASVLDSTRQASALYNWIQDLIRQAREAGEGNPPEGADRSAQRSHQRGRKAPASDSGDGDGRKATAAIPEGGETDREREPRSLGQIAARAAQASALSPEELKKLLEQGAQIDPSQSSGAADGEGMYLTQLTRQAGQPSFEQMREQLGEIGSDDRATDAW